MSAMAFQITGVSIVYWTVCSRKKKRKKEKKCSASLAFVRGIRRWPLNSPPHKGPVARKMFPFDDVIMKLLSYSPDLRKQIIGGTLMKDISSQRDCIEGCRHSFACAAVDYNRQTHTCWFHSNTGACAQLEPKNEVRNFRMSNCSGVISPVSGKSFSDYHELLMKWQFP